MPQRVSHQGNPVVHLGLAIPSKCNKSQVRTEPTARSPLQTTAETRARGPTHARMRAFVAAAFRRAGLRIWNSRTSYPIRLALRQYVDELDAPGLVAKIDPRDGYGQIEAQRSGAAGIHVND